MDDHCNVLTLFLTQISIAASDPNKPTLAGVKWDFPLVLDEFAGENKRKEAQNTLAECYH